MDVLQFRALFLGVTLNILHHFYSALFFERLGDTFNVAATIVWAFCWILFPKALVRVLFSQGPTMAYLKR